MAKNKNNQAIWNTRIKKKASSLFEKVGSSISIDKRLYREDILVSIAHVEMLFKQKIISFKIKNKIIYGLQKIEKEISKNNFEFNTKYEDIHMNIEKRLFQIIGEEALEICEYLVRSGAVDLVVVDSVAALVPKAELEGDMGDSHIGLQARLMSQAL